MAAPPSHTLVLSFEDARRVVEDHASHVLLGGHETVDLLHAGGRTLAEPITADRDIPPFPRSTRDGYAVRSADLAPLPAKLKVIGEIKAGPESANALPALDQGETFSIMTGAPAPQGADAVVMVEYTSLQNEHVTITKGIAAGENIVARGAEARSGGLLLNSGTRLKEAAIALAASVGKSRLQVFVRPRVAVLTTGDEIADVDDARIGPTQIRNSNSFSLAAQIQEAGGEPVLLPIAPDEQQRLRQLMEQGLHADLLLMTGGVSMGRYDLVEQVLAEMRAEFFFTGARIQPGRPVVFGRVPCVANAPASAGAPAPPHKYFFGLPGNPVSTMVTCELFVRPMLEALAGMSPQPLPFLHTRLKSEIRVKPGLTRFLPAVLSGQYDNSQAELVSWQGSGDIAARTRSNCLLVIPPDREHILAGEWVAILLR
ncbi:MAG: gephyrin-like molybdotransferase Glp [Candidatus Sulfotelmatobacter sp.]